MPCVYSAQEFVFPRGKFLISRKCRTEKNANSGSLIAVEMDSYFHEKLQYLCFILLESSFYPREISVHFCSQKGQENE